MATASSLVHFKLIENSAAQPKAGGGGSQAVVDSATREALCLALTGLPLRAFAGPAPRALQGAGQPPPSQVLETAARKWLCLS